MLALVSLLGLGITQSARANYMVMLEQVGSNVVATGSGAINLTDLTFQSHGTSGSGIDPINGILTVGILENTHIYTGFSGPTSFGSGGFLSASSGSGDIVGIFANSPSQIIVPQGYVSGQRSIRQLNF